MSGNLCQSFTSYLNFSTFLGCVLLCLFLSWWIRIPRRLPPGPWGVPLLGYIPNLALAIYRTGLTPQQLFEKIAIKYGKIFSMKLTRTLIVVLNDYNSIKEAFQNPLLNDRPMHVIDKELSFETDKLSSKMRHSGVVFGSGQSWKNQRRFTLNTLRDFGVMRRTFEDQISAETQVLIREISLKHDEPFDPHSLIGNSVSNVICSVVFGKRYEYTDTEFQEMLNIMDQRVKLSGSSGAHIVYPMAKYLQPRIHTRLQELQSQHYQFVQRIVDDHRLVHNPDNIPNDFIDAFVSEIKNQKKDQESHLNYSTIITTIVDLFVAGSETTATTLRWALLYMVGNQDIQGLIHTEIDDVIGRDRLPRLSDQSELPYTEATLLEIQRVTAIIPLGLIHQAAKDTTLNGYDIPQGSFLISNIWAVHHDPDIWEEPFEFKPTRFLDENKKVRQRPEIIPFSTGRRVCLGENVAKMELFLFFTHLMHQFTVSSPSEDPQLSYKGTGALVNAPHSFEIVATPR